MACDYRLRTDEIPGQTGIKIFDVTLVEGRNLTMTQTVVAMRRKPLETNHELRNRLARAAFEMGLLACGGPDRVVPEMLGVFQGEPGG